MFILFLLLYVLALTPLLVSPLCHDSSWVALPRFGMGATADSLGMLLSALRRQQRPLMAAGARIANSIGVTLSTWCGDAVSHVHNPVDEGRPGKEWGDGQREELGNSQ